MNERIRENVPYRILNAIGIATRNMGRDNSLWRYVKMSDIIKAKKIRPGHSIPGLDNAYVIESERSDGYTSIPGGSSRYSVALGDDHQIVTFNDALGGEGYLLLPRDMPVTVKDKTPDWF